MRTDLTTLAAALLPLGVSCNYLPLISSVSYNAVNSRADVLPPYKNSSYSVDERVEDLIKRMTIEEKAGQLFHFMVSQGPLNDSTRGNSTDTMVAKMLLSHFNLSGDLVDAKETAKFINEVQQLALQTRLGIPVTISSDPRHSFTENLGTGFRAGAFSEWPESLGLAAIRDPSLVRKFAEVAREEYLAVGIRAALHPQVDLATEPRWARLGNTWGENATLTSELLVEYIKGFQGEEIGPRSVTTVTKHFPGGGPMENGEDSHFIYGKNQTYPGNNFDYHLIPFKAAIAAGARQIMPYYSRPIGTKYDPVGFSFNKQIVIGLLREELGFEGIVVSDWGLITDGVILGQDMPARAWGVEHLSELERAAMVLNAGVDQFGGEQRPELIVQLVKEGTISEERIDVSVRRLMREKFLLGLFDNPFVDPEAAAKLVGTEEYLRLGKDAQRRAYTLLTNKDEILPLKNTDAATKFYVEGFNATLLEARKFTVVKTPQEADLALLRLQAPYEPRPGGFEANYHAGSLEFSATEKARQAAIYSAVPTIVDLMLDRPAAVPEIFKSAAAVFGSFGSGSEAFLDVVFGQASPEGRLPFDLPRSQKAVEASREDVPYDTENPVFRFGDGLRYTQ
ncbi:hypothetical protein MCOR07_010040 [Pyricularia oryzae]|nr:hypothetical protein MCOR01_003932 [Pyricularia oryzae]KAI6335542.1 hypothetical protein MCOR30_003821 [Pyricularia oryzae]KAI6357868.1 hypothetical protein MCOR31_010116 [Pyricularia oryzae]KAI6393856.1 hypothetical protein MCOR23_007815 [Pyricularia oryzae]KAI6407237.1 hypothetical protein MCOR20_005845 [Pyricularia oryzae]